MAYQLPKRSLTFLKDLSKNNNRNWFNDHKDRYLDAREGVIGLVDEVLGVMKQSDLIDTASGKAAMYRIYRDVRFSKNKTPYNVHWSAMFRRAMAMRRGTYYIRIEAGGNSRVGGGFWGPNPADMKLIRSHLADDASPLRKVLRAKRFKDTFNEMQGDQVKTAPKGYSREHPNIDLLRYKQFYAFRAFSDKEVLQPEFAGEVVKTLKAIRPFFDCMTEMLTTDLNGESLLDG